MVNGVRNDMDFKDVCRIFGLVCFSETGPQVALTSLEFAIESRTDLEFLILLPSPLWCRDCRHEIPCLAHYRIILMKKLNFFELYFKIY